MEIKGIDYKSGLARFRGKADRYNKALFKFADSKDLAIQAFEEAMRPDNIAETRARIHTLKGVAGNLAIDGIFNLCVEFEKTIIAGQPNEEIYGNLYNEYNTIKTDIISKLESETPAAESESGSRSACLNLLSELRRNAERYDAAACEFTIKKLRKNKWSGVDPVTLERICNLAESYNFDEATGLINTV